MSTVLDLVTQTRREIMRKVAVLFALLAIAHATSAQDNRSPILSWIGADAGWDGSSVGFGINIEFGFQVHEGVYLAVSIETLITPAIAGNFSQNSMIGAGIRYYPFDNGFVVGIDMGACQLDPHPATGGAYWVPGASCILGYDFGVIVVGAKGNLYFSSAPQGSLGLFMDFGGEVAAAIFGALLGGRS
jgi:hypothetical protein